jgi:hypothetical protein
LTRFIWYAQKPEEAGSAGYSAGDVIQDEEKLETDDRPAPPEEEGVAGDEPVQSPGDLADTAADLSIASPPPETPKDSNPSTSIPSKEPISTGTFKDSAVTLSSEAPTSSAIATKPAEATKGSGDTPTSTPNKAIDDSGDISGDEAHKDARHEGYERLPSQDGSSGE